MNVRMASFVMGTASYDCEPNFVVVARAST